MMKAALTSVTLAAPISSQARSEELSKAELFRLQGECAALGRSFIADLGACLSNRRISLGDGMRVGFCLCP